MPNIYDLRIDIFFALHSNSCILYADNTGNVLYSRFVHTVEKILKWGLLLTFILFFIVIVCYLVSFFFSPSTFALDTFCIKIHLPVSFFNLAVVFFYYYYSVINNTFVVILLINVSFQMAKGQIKKIKKLRINTILSISLFLSRIRFSDHNNNNYPEMKIKNRIHSLSIYNNICHYKLSVCELFYIFRFDLAANADRRWKWTETKTK